MYNLPRLTPSAQLFNNKPIISFQLLVNFNTVLCIHKVKLNLIHSYITFPSSTHPYSTRNYSKITIPQSQTNYGKFSISTKGAELYNSLPRIITNNKSLSIFKKQALQYLKSTL